MAEITQKTAIGKLGTGLIVNNGVVVLDEELVQDAIDDSIGSFATTLIWKPITGFTATPASTSTITTATDWTSSVTVGTPLMYTIGGVVYYGIVTAITASLITIMGAPLSGSITALSFSDESRVCQTDFFISGKFADAINSTLLQLDMNTSFTWSLGPARLVGFKAIVRTDDSGATQPKVNVSIGGNAVCTSNTNAGLAVAETWVSTVVDINVTNYVVARGAAIEITTDGSGTNKDAENLTISGIFVLV